MPEQSNDIFGLTDADGTNTSSTGVLSAQPVNKKTNNKEKVKSKDFKFLCLA
jgi:hypothetical protein